MFNNLFNGIKWFVQRGRRGYSQEDTWDLADYFCRLLPPMIRELQGKCGCPSEFYDRESVNNECHKWDETLEEMAQGFEAAKWIKDMSISSSIRELNGKRGYNFDFKSFDNAEEKMNKGLALFAKHFLSLWN